MAVAKALFLMYNTMFHKLIDEANMHKLMYFIQRESLIVNDDVLFDEDFYGWKYGPVLLSIRKEFQKGTLFEFIDDTVSQEVIKLLKNVLDRFGHISSWNLSVMSHEELSWKLSRKGLNSSENGFVNLSIDAMRLDAIREAALRKNNNNAFI